MASAQDIGSFFKLKCPACNIQLKDIIEHKQRFYTCTRCKGAWFDKGQVPAVVYTIIAEGKVEGPSVAEAYNKKPLVYKQGDHPPRRCPRCDEYMETLNYSFDSNVFVDRCPSCHGIWADESEIEWIARYIKGNPKVIEFARSYAQAQAESIRSKIRDQKLKEDLKSSRFSLGRLILMRLSIIPIPLKDDNLISTVPYVTIGLIAVNVIIFLLQSAFVQDLKSYASIVGLVSANAFQLPRLYAFISSMFVHAGILHLVINMLFLWIFGDNIEDRWGSLRFLLFYIMAGIVSNIAQVLMYPGSIIPGIGASGAIAGMMGAYIVLYPRNPVQTFWLGEIRQLSAFAYLLPWFLMQLVFGTIQTAGCRQTIIGYWVHIGGFLFGVLVAYIYRKRSMV